MGLRKRVFDERTADEIYEQMTPEEREQFDKMCEEQLKHTHDNDMIEALKKNPTYIDFDTDMDMEEFLKRVMAGEYDAK